jgi:uncharacterized protein YndB with AHSA1/START domain
VNVNEGQLEQISDHQWRITFARTLAHPRDKVWRALSEHEHLRAWFPFEIEGEFAPGAPLRFSLREHDLPPMEGEMLAYEPPTLLEFRWGPDVLRFELAADGDDTVLTFTDTIEELGKAARDGIGWHICLDRLEYELAGKEAPWEPMQRHKELNPSYVERFGPEAATIGPPEEVMKSE